MPESNVRSVTRSTTPNPHPGTLPHPPTPTPAPSTTPPHPHPGTFPTRQPPPRHPPLPPPNPHPGTFPTRQPPPRHPPLPPPNPHPGTPNVALKPFQYLKCLVSKNDASCVRFKVFPTTVSVLSQHSSDTAKCRMLAPETPDLLKSDRVFTPPLHSHSDK